jgi:hypothetical protein
MTLDLLKALEKGAPLNLIEHDGNFTAIETEVNAKVATTDPRLNDARTPAAHSHVVGDVTGLQGVLDSKATTETVSALSTTVAGKAATTDPRFTDRRGIATGDYTGFTVAAGGAATLAPAGVVAAITAATAPQASAIVTALNTPIVAAVENMVVAEATAPLSAITLPTYSLVAINNAGVWSVSALQLGSAATANIEVAGAPPVATISAGAVTWDFTGTLEVVTNVGANVTAITVANLALYARGVVELNFSGAFTVTFPSTWKVPSGFNPTYTGASGQTVYLTVYRRASTVYHVTIGDRLTVVA